MPSTDIFVPTGYLDPRIESLPPAPQAGQDFSGRLDGVVIPVWAGDVYLAKACCASVRQYLGDIPITLLVDGADTDTSEIQRLHGVQRLVVQEVMDAEYLRLCTGTSWTKLLLFWMGPYERFLCLDADTILWGDVRCYAEFDQYDFIAAYHLHDEVVLQDPGELQRCLFDLDIAQRLSPGLKWQQRDFANCGVFFARRGIFTQAQLMEWRRLDCWRCYEQGLLNYLRWRSVPGESPRMGGHRLQLFPADTTCKPENRFLRRDFPRPLVVHWVGKKPKIGRPFRAANDCRKAFLRQTGRANLLDVRLFIEDITIWLQRQRRSLSRRFKTRPRYPKP
jgi:hypothetical protein